MASEADLSQSDARDRRRFSEVRSAFKFELESIGETVSEHRPDHGRHERDRARPAAEFLKRDNTVLITGRTEDGLEAAARSLPGVHTFVCDQSDPAAIIRLCEDATSRFPNLNMLINNAGIGLKRNLNDERVTLDDLEREIRSNLTGPIQLVQQFMPQLKRQPTAAIMNVTSGLAFVPLALKPIYCATKAAMHFYTQSLRVQVARSSIKVIELAPPATKTNFNKGQEELNMASAMDAGKVARDAMRGLERGHEEILPGMSPVLRLIGRVAPGLTLARAAAERLGA